MQEWVTLSRFYYALQTPNLSPSTGAQRRPVALLSAPLRAAKLILAEWRWQPLDLITGPNTRAWISAPLYLGKLDILEMMTSSHVVVRRASLEFLAWAIWGGKKTQECLGAKNVSPVITRWSENRPGRVSLLKIRPKCTMIYKVCSCNACIFLFLAASDCLQ